MSLQLVLVSTTPWLVKNYKFIIFFFTKLSFKHFAEYVKCVDEISIFVTLCDESITDGGGKEVEVALDKEVWRAYG